MFHRHPWTSIASNSFHEEPHSRQYIETIIAVNLLRFTTTLLNYPLENWLVIQLTVRIGLSAKVWSCSRLKLDVRLTS